MMGKKKKSPAISEKNIFNALLGSLEYGLTIQDRDYNILFQNDFMRNHFGSSSGKCYEVYEYRDTPCKGCPVREAFRDEKSHDAERIVREPTGKLRVWLNTAIPIRNDQGEVDSCLEIVRDISSLKRMKKSIIENEARLHTLLQTIPDLIWLKNENGVYLACNETFERFFGAKEDVIVGKTDYDFVDGELADLFRENDRRAMAAGKPTCNEEWITFADDGHSALLDTIKTPMFDPEGNLVGVLGIGRDITERKRTEEEQKKLMNQLNQAQKMESMGRLAGGVAHDFNNMLSVILGRAEMLLEDTDPDQPICADLKEIKEAAQRSADVTRQLLAFARKQTIAPKVIDLNEVIENILKMLRRLIGENIELLWHPGKNLWPIKMDPSQVDQILANLSVNARDAITKEGKLIIETSNITVDKTYLDNHPGFSPGEFVQLTVSDNGCGMDQETLNNLFEPFFTTKGIDKGTGLGLATVYGIVKQNDGFINVYSEPDNGSSFKIFLSRHMFSGEQMHAKERAKAVLRGSESILIVEDEASILKMTEQMLKRLGYNVLTANRPKDAINLAREHNREIHLLLTDVVMPEMNGQDLFKSLLPIYPNLKCLFMSGYTANVIAHHGVLAKGIHYIQKPFSRQGLSSKLRDVLDDDNS